MILQLVFQSYGEIIMKKAFIILAGLLLIVILVSFVSGEETEKVSLFRKEMTVGTDICIDDITDFYYTKENINYGAFYQRYRFYEEDGRHLFFHETRERKNDYGPCTEKDTTLTGTVELSEEQWSQFFDLLRGGTVIARGDSAESGSTGPWLYLYWKDDKSKYQQFAFGSYGIQNDFEQFCLALAK